MGLAWTELARATCGTIRPKLFKMGALVQVRVRRVWVRLSLAYSLAPLFWEMSQRLATASKPGAPDGPGTLPKDWSSGAAAACSKRA